MTQIEKITSIIHNFNNIGDFTIYKKAKTVHNPFALIEIKNCIAHIEVLNLSGSGNDILYSLRDAGFTVKKIGLDIYVVKKQKRSLNGTNQYGPGNNPYIAFYKGKRIELYADSSYQAQLKAAGIFKAKHSYDVDVSLAEEEEEDKTPEPAPQPKLHKQLAPTTNKYYSFDYHEGEFKEEPTAKPVKLNYDGDFFVVKNTIGYTIYEATSGMKLGDTQKTLSGAIEFINDNIARNVKKSNQPLSAFVQLQIDKKGLSPRYQAQESKPQPEAWQLTRSEYAADQIKNHGRNANPGIAIAHKKTVEQAIADGKPVPAEVLADYPELSAQPQPEPWQLTLDEFTIAVYTKGYDFRQLGMDRKPIQPVVQSYIASTDQQNKAIAKERIDAAIKQHHAGEIANALREGKPVPEKVLIDYPQWKNYSDRKNQPAEPAREQQLPPETEIYNFVHQVISDYESGERLTRSNIRSIAEVIFAVMPDERILRELTEVAQYKIAKPIMAQMYGESDGTTLEKLFAFYEKMPVYDYRDSTTSVMQQFSTPIFIGWIMAKYVGMNRSAPPKTVFEPSAGNALLISSFNKNAVTVNELDPIRNQVLKYLGYDNRTMLDASQPFQGFAKQFSMVMSNPPFYSNSSNKEPVIYGGMRISSFDHVCVLRALDTMKDDGKAAFLIDGVAGNRFYPNAYFNEQGEFAGEHKNFMNYIYSYYNVEDVISLNGHKLYSRQGQATNLRIVLINGRRKAPDLEAYPPKYNPLIDKLIDTPQELWDRVMYPRRHAEIIRQDEEQRLIGKIISAHRAGRQDEFNEAKAGLESLGYTILIKAGKLNLQKGTKANTQFSKIILHEIKATYNL